MMDETILGLFDQHREFQTEQTCRSYLAALREKFRPACPTKCGNIEWRKTPTGFLRCRKCHHQMSVTASTIFHHTRLPLKDWFRAMWYVAHRPDGTSASKLQEAIGLKGYDQAWKLLKKLQTLMRGRPEKMRLSNLILIDEAWINTAKNRVLVVVARGYQDSARTQREKELRMKQVSVEEANDLLPAIGPWLGPRVTFTKTGKPLREKTIIMTDRWEGYEGLRQKSSEIRHAFFSADSELGTNPEPEIKEIADLFQNRLMRIHHSNVRPSHLDYCISEFLFHYRLPSRTAEQRFNALISSAIRTLPITAEALKDKTARKELL